MHDHSFRLRKLNNSIHFSKIDPNLRKGFDVGNAISSCFSKYATFSGRASRSEYWFFYLFYLIVLIMGNIIDAAAGTTFVNLLCLAALFLPILAVSVRRMHDTGKSGWFILIPIYNLVLLCTPSVGDNSYGAKP